MRSEDQLSKNPEGVQTFRVNFWKQDPINNLKLNKK